MSAPTVSNPAKVTGAEASPYVRTFEHLVMEGALEHPAWALELRRAAIARFARLGLPTVRHEDWRYTSLAPLARLPFRPILHLDPRGLDETALQGLGVPDFGGSRLVFVDGVLAPGLSRILPEAGVTLAGLADRLASDGVLIRRHLGRLAPVDRENPLLALNTAFFRDGAYLHVAAGKQASLVQLVFVASGAEAGFTASPRNLLLFERGTQAVVVEHYVSLGGEPAFTNAACEVIVEEGASVEQIKVQDEHPAAYHIGALEVRVDRGATYLYHSIALGARLSRNNIHSFFAGERVECVLNGLYLVDGERLADHHMVVEHASPHCASHEYFNGILAGKARGVFHGRILVRPGAQKTDAKQTNKNLLLSDEAQASTKPQLEIYADDVRCTHGATIGQLNDDAIYYLRSRGIGREQARHMLVHAFAGEILDRVRHAGIRGHLDRVVWDRLEAVPELAPRP
ncbi:MAG: Fe-S cluster assembly protein SufD [Limisphaerales bacterium]